MPVNEEEIIDLSGSLPDYTYDVFVTFYEKGEITLTQAQNFAKMYAMGYLGYNIDLTSVEGKTLKVYYHEPS